MATTVGYRLDATRSVVRGDPHVTHINVLDPGASPLDYYGFELRRLREAANLTQRQLGDVLNYTGSLVGRSRPPGRCRPSSSASGWMRPW